MLGEKKKGEIGTGTLNGPGGKLDPGETLVECLVRETFEELEIRLNPATLEEIAVITFFAAGVSDFKVHIYWTDEFEGELHETADMIPSWHALNKLPFDQMLEGDREWFAKAVRGEKFNANVYYKERAKEFERIEYLPFVSK